MDPEEKNQTNGRTSDTILAQALLIERLEAEVTDLQQTIRTGTLTYRRDIAPLIQGIAGEWRLLTIMLDSTLEVIRSVQRTEEHGETIRRIQEARSHSEDRYRSLFYLYEEMSKSPASF